MSNFKLSTSMTASGRIGQNFSCAIIETATRCNPEQIPDLRAEISEMIVVAESELAEAHNDIQTNWRSNTGRTGRRMSARVTRATARLHILEAAIKALN